MNRQRNRKFNRFLRRLETHILCILTALGAATVVYALLAPLAYAERGYFALGGEALVTFLVFYFGYPFLLQHHKRKKQRSIKRARAKIYGFKR